jgi:hypothetical protein
MPRLFIFADEAGCFNFSRNFGASKYYIICTISCASCSELGSSLLELRRRLVWERAEIGDYFHACEDRQAVRDRVFAVLRTHNFSIQATIMEKSKAYPHIRATNHKFYKYGWFFHFKHAAPKMIQAQTTELQITTASVAVRKAQGVFSAAVNDVVQQVVEGSTYRTNFCPAIADPCLQAADYCTWAIQRRWERNDTRSYDLIKDRIVHEFDMWAHGSTHHY